MSIYEREQIGKIVIIKNIIFENSLTNKKEADHAWNVGRPCIIIYSDNDYDYILPLKSRIKDEKYESQHFLLDETKFISLQITRMAKKNCNSSSNQRTTSGAINLQKIYKIPISWHLEAAKITLEAYKELIEKLKEYHNIEDLNTILKNAQSVRGR